MNADITIRPCAGLAEYEIVTDLEMRIWQCDEREATASHIALIAAKTGGQVMGAFVGAEMIGFSLAFVGKRGDLTYLHSHLTGVVAEYQNAGVGKMLKLAQRTDALARGFALMEWTFDPFAPRNAWFNVMKLGAVMRRFIPNLYGITTSAIHGGLPTDRLVAEWWMDAPRVQAALAGNQPTIPEHGERVVVPLNLQTLAQTDRAKALALQSQLSSKFESLFAAGFAVVALEREAEQVIYHLSQAHGVQALA